MNFFKIIVLYLLINLATLTNLYAVDETDNTQNIVEKAKEINKKVKEKQANQELNISSEVSQEEPLPLNDPFAGDASLAGMGSSNVAGRSEDSDNEMSLYNFKLAGLISGKDYSYISLVNSGGEVLTMTLGQYLGEIQLVDLRLTEAIFKRDDGKFMIIDFNNQVRESDDY